MQPTVITVPRASSYEVAGAGHRERAIASWKLTPRGVSFQLAALVSIRQILKRQLIAQVNTPQPQRLAICDVVQLLLIG